MTKYCPKCDGDQPVILVQEEETFPVKGSPVTIMSTICRCATCGTDILDMEIDDNNLRKAYAKFREQNSLLQHEDIKASYPQQM
jgi:hypothetical protein